MEPLRMRNIIKIPSLILLILLIGPFALASDKIGSTSVLPPPQSTTIENQNLMSSPTPQLNQGMTIMGPNALTPPPFKMQDGKKDDG
jgi:hypothetical protein